MVGNCKFNSSILKQRMEQVLVSHSFIVCIFQILCMIGEAFDSHSDDICGSVVNIRSKGDKIGLWTANAKEESSVLSIG